MRIISYIDDICQKNGCGTRDIGCNRMLLASMPVKRYPDREVMFVMPAIHENLKRLRIARGLTQREVAEKLFLTRQAISSYESGRTQPDIDTLKRFAQLYDVDITSVLYGDVKTLRRQKLLHVTSIITWIILFLGSLASSVPVWIANHYFVAQNGASFDSVSSIVETRFALLDAHEFFDSFSGASFFVMAIALLVLTAGMEPPIKAKAKLKFLAVLLIGCAAAVLPWMLSDPFYGFWDYCIVPVRNLLFAALIFGLSFAGERMHRKISARAG